MRISTLEMEARLMYYLDINANLVVPNITNISGLVMFEADMLSLSKSGYATAIEIKVSKADLKNDLKKQHIINKDSFTYGLDFYYKNLKYFYYAVPEYLEEEALKQIPSFCGLLVLKEVSYSHWNTNYKKKQIEFVREAKVLFQTKWDDKMRYNLARLGTMRIMSLKYKLLNYKSKLK